MRNLGLFLVSIVASFILAYPFGILAGRIFFVGVEGFIVPSSISNYLDGLVFSYLFIVPVIYQLWGRNKKWLASLMLAMPVLILSVAIGSRYLEWACLFFAAGIVVAGIIEQIKKPKGVRA